MSSIRFEHVNKSFGKTQVLQNFSMELESSDMKIVLGGSGSGKSTILKLILGLVRPDSGRVFVGNEDLTELSEDELMPIRGKIGMVFQEGALFDSLTVGDNVAYRLREQRELDESEIRQVVEEFLGFVGLSAAIDKMPSELSGGMRRRVAIARALVGNPRIMLYDEPTAGLDPITGRTICELVMRLRDLDRVTSIFVTHDLKAAMTMAGEVAVRGDSEGVRFEERRDDSPDNTRFVMISRGTVLLEGTDRDLTGTSNEYIREFLD